MKKGFSLIELVVVIGLITLLTLTISSILLTSVITSNRIRTTTKIKQAGNYAIGQIQSMVRGAKSIPSCDSSAGSITTTNPDGFTTTLTTELDGTNTRIASNSGVYLTPESSNVTSFQLLCEPTDTEPSLIKVSFDLQDTVVTRSVENPILHFETSITTRN